MSIKRKQSIGNTYMESNLKNLDYLISKGATFGVDTEANLLSSKFIVVNAYGNMFGYDKLSKKIENQVKKICIKIGGIK